MRPAFDFLFLVLPVLIVAIAVMQPIVDPRMLMLDPSIVAKETGECCRAYYGIISSLGIIGWVSTAAICLFSIILLNVLNGSQRAIMFASVAGLVTAVMALDDAFHIHETVAPMLGIAPASVLGAYGMLACLYAVSAWRAGGNVNGFLLIAACLLLLTNVSMETYLQSRDSLMVSLEHGARFIGIYCWLGFHIKVMIGLIIGAIDKDGMTLKKRRVAFVLSPFEDRMVRA